MPLTNQTTCWVVTDGKSGMENQAVGLAEALQLAPVVKRVKLRWPWAPLAPYLRAGLGSAFSRTGDSIAPPWPQLLIATGRQSVPASLLVKRSHPETFTIQLQNPAIDPGLFDLVVAPEHDGLSGANVISTRGALHRVTPLMLHQAAENLAPALSHLPSPRIAALIGGSNAVYKLTPREMTRIAGQLVHLAKITGGSMIVTPSRRTGGANLAILQNNLRSVPSYVWDGRGKNPYYGMLGLADYILATCDSINMVSEACTTGKPVYVIDLPGGSEKFRGFHRSMREAGLTRRFEGRLEMWSYKPLNDVRLVADRVRQEMEIRAP
jgi:mitochondrial fission protein ELM1